MLKRKKLLAALLAGTMMLSLVGCGKKADTSGDTTDPSTPPAETQLTPWEEASQIYNTEETDEELYQKAIEEGVSAEEEAPVRELLPRRLFPLRALLSRKSIPALTAFPSTSPPTSCSRRSPVSTMPASM